MDSKIRIYQVEFKPDQNAVVESLQQYLKTATLRYKSDTFQYQQIAIDMVIKVPMEQSKLNIPGNYVEIIQDDIHYYFYIMNAKWTAKNTLRLVLSMDTLNTFWTEIQACLDKQTHVSRKYYDRWKRVDTKIYPLIDNHPEDITQPYMRRSGQPHIVGNTKHWTLVYRTDYDTDVKANPLTCYVIPETDVPITPTAYGTYTLTRNAAAPGTWWVMTVGNNPNDVFTIKSGNTARTIEMRNYSRAAFVIETDCIHAYVYTLDTPSVDIKADKIIFDRCKEIYRQSQAFDVGFSLASADFTNPLVMDAGMSTGTLQNFKAWYENNKTDTRLVKILELPYAPFTKQYDSNNKMIIPDGFSLYYGLLRYDGAVEMINNIRSYHSLGPQSIDMSTLSLTEQAEPLLYETKLWNSNYYTYKFIYDNNVHVLKLEDFKHSGTKPSYDVNISFEASTGMDNSLVFKFDSNETMDSDFGEYLVCNRSTEIPYYTNEYLNYLRYGKAVDERNRASSIVSTVVSGVGSGISTAASLAFALTGAGAASGGVLGGMLGAGIGIASTIIATVASVQKANDQINAKIDNYQHQASGVSAANDLSVFKAYGKNKLLLTAYEPVYELKESIGRYFELFGYSCDFYGVPNFKTRIWSDYFVIEPVFYNNPILDAYQADIATRMKAGFRIFHRNDDISNENGVLIHYDFNNEYENWERSITGR